MFTPTIHPCFKALRQAGFAALMLGTMLAGSALGTTGAYAQQQAQMTISDYGRTRSIALETNKSMILDLPADVAEVVVSQPTVAGAIMRTTRRAIIQGILGGNTNILFLDANGQAIAVLDLKVAKEPSQVGEALEAALARILPGSAIQVDSVNLKDDTNRVVLSGTVASSQDADRALAIAIQYAGDPTNVASVIDVSGGQQVLLQVTVAEVSRDAVKQLGINLSGSLSVGSLNASFGSAQTALPNGIGADFEVPNVSISAELRALETRGAVRTLAEPALTAISGQTAEFLAGGQIPVLSSIDDGERIYTLKDFGVKLKFTPTIKSSGLIGLAVETEVSELSEQSFNNGTEDIPGFNTRSAKTSVELRAGETLAIAGIIQDKVRQQISGLPGLGNIPILGALFRSREFQHSQTELVILVTPFIAKPTTQALPLPTDAFVPASDAEAIFLGHMQTQYGVGGGNGMRGTLNGSVGFVLD
ncbi:type II and III secretion system protein family protein [uncultured Devosia sp.]|uniref:type II and III secretion system protein family protein n=1 Tax=uncultured Devosia sp. TaxID=211434 RepID=UPI0035CBE5F7